MRRIARYLAVVALAVMATPLAGMAHAQQDAVERELEKYRSMMKADPWSNPANLDADRGEVLWKKSAGPKNASLEQCDLGKGPGKVDGAFAELPRYFADADRVMDAETRILWCREKLQGIDNAEFLKNPHPGGGAPVKTSALSRRGSRRNPTA